MKLLQKIGIIGVAVFALSILYSSSAYAVSYISPDPADNNDDTWLEVSTIVLGNSLDAPSSTVVIYSNTPNPQIIIDHYNHCTDANTNYGIDSSRPPFSSGSDTQFSLFQGGDPTSFTYAAPIVNNSIRPVGAGCNGDNYVFTPFLTERGAPGSGLESFYVARLNAYMTVPNGVNAFKVRVLDGGGNQNGYVSYTNQDSYKFSLQKRPGSAGGQSDIGIKFAMPCNTPATINSALAWYDDDYNSGNQDTNLQFTLSSRPRGSSGPYSTFLTNTSDWGGEGVNKSIPVTLTRSDEYLWEWKNVNNSNGIQFTVPFNSIFSEVTCIAYDLVPSLSVNSTTVEPGSVVTASSSVRNNGPTNSNPTQWQVSRFTLAPGEGVPNAGGGTSGGAPCSGFYKSPPSCTVISSGNQAFNVGDTGLPSVNNQVDDLPVGSRICYALSVQPHRHDTADWRHSAPVCVKVGKRPKVQVWGGDVISRGAIRTSTTTKNTGSGMRTFGSWGEYGIFSLSSNNAMASGSGLVGAGAPSSSQGSWSALTFANKSGVFGSYVSLPAKSAVASYFLNRASSPLPSTNLSLNGLTGILRYNGGSDVVINASTISTGQSVVIVAPNANVRIVGNIAYGSGPFANVTQIPQVVIVAANVWIAGGVTNVDSWLVASGSVVTCSDVTTGAQLSSNICSNPLTINGPVISNSLYLRRTAGSNTGAASGDPAERINLRADAYLWAKTQTNVDGNATTVFSYELPPRF